MIIEFVTIVIVSFLIGFILGKKEGRMLGYYEGKAAAPLILREQSLSQGRCCLCHSSAAPEDTGRAKE